MFHLFGCIISPMWIHSCQSSWRVWRPLLTKFTGDLCLPSPGSHRFRENGSHHSLHLTRAFGALLYRGLLHLLGGIV
jgi:hypothetical protein